MASNLKRSKRSVGRRILDLQNKVSGLQKRAGPLALGENVVSTASLEPGAVGGWVVDSNAIYSGTKTASGSYASSNSITIGSSPNGYISATNFRIDANGNAFFRGAINGGTIDIGDFDDSSFHVNATGDMWLGAGDINNATFKVTANGTLSATGASISGTLTAGAGSAIGPFTVSSSAITGSWSSFNVSMFADVQISDDAPVATYGGFSIGGTQLSLFTNLGLYLFAGSTPPLWSSKQTTTYLERGKFLLSKSGGSRMDFDTGKITFWKNSNQISTIHGEIYHNNDGLFIRRNSGDTKLVFIAQNADNSEFFGLGKPLPITVMGNWQDLYWNNAFGTFGVTASSKALKENIETLGEVGHIIDQLRPVSFIAKASEGLTPEQDAMRRAQVEYGFIAEEVMEIDNFHLSVYADENGEFVAKDWRHRSMTTLLVKEVQSLRARVADLEQQVSN